ncbi:uncharacterized protein PFL1_04464 [Pseudozyma flocculosa PF-1]|uniref:Uncharacterized protein n=2 Tax=Pseudozyma flocculosa TaxID=84751 RepID=A0A5C3FEY7_9BASI|nr:uncharacterized protein PFL1_04464 [Pseudozyma flocculosa PF-1]EPQ28137.1 hypothetical protein PFL1_04464 [Pseudozyma flocculosa PF-1]SPO41939.1 uncharacterized protein PSFLO_07422 [Pseudozyma flocculosa]
MPLRPSATQMRTSTIFAMLALLGTAKAAHEAWCTAAKDGSGPPDPRFTPVCCAVSQESKNILYNRAVGKCQDKEGRRGTIDERAFQNCCIDNGVGGNSD